MRYYVSATLQPLVRATDPMRFPLPSRITPIADDHPNPSLSLRSVDRMTFRHEVDAAYAEEARMLVGYELERRLVPLLDLMVRSTPDMLTASHRYRLAVDVDGRHATAEIEAADVLPAAEVRRHLLAKLCRVIADGLELSPV